MLSFASLFIVVSVCFKFLFAAPISQEILTSNPGKVFLWSYNDGTHSYNTKSMDINSAMGSIADISKDYELIVFLSPTAEDTMQETIMNANNLHVLNYIYPNSNQDNSISMNLKTIFPSQKIASKKAFQTATQELANNNVPDFIEIQNNHEMANVYSNALMNELPSNLKSKILFVSYTDITRASPVSATNNRKLEGFYSGAIDSFSADIDMMGLGAAATTNSTLSPEGSEFSIYFYYPLTGKLYLYLTPDIFTGLMTGLFIFFTVLIGVTCLGQIQGMSTFYDKLPVVGREA